MKKKKINPLFDIHRTGMNVTFINSFKYSDTDTSNFIDAVKGYDTTLNYEAIAYLFRDLKDGDNWLPGYAMWIMYGGSADSCKLNIFNPANTDAAFRLTYPAGITASASGIVGNGISQYCRTYFTGNLLTLNNTCLVFYSGTNNNVGFEFDVSTSNSARHTLACKFTDNKLYGTSYTTSNWINATNSDSRGFHAENRTSSSVHNFWQRGNKIYEVNTSGGSLTNLEYYILTRNLNGATAFFSTKQCRFAAIIPGRSDVQMTALYNAIQAYQTRLGRQV